MRKSARFINPDHKTLKQLLDANIPMLDWRTLFTLEKVGVEGQISHAALFTPEEIDLLDNYFQMFVAPGPCIRCGAKQGGDSIDQVLGVCKFTWGIVHGEGYCSVCMWPARALHYKIGPILRLEMILQVHPTRVKVS